jgi:hypothetical protein
LFHSLNDVNGIPKKAYRLIDIKNKRITTPAMPFLFRINSEIKVKLLFIL